MLPGAIRITHWKDPVPHLPPREFKFWHFHTEVFYDEKFTKFTICDSSGEDPFCADKFPLAHDNDDHINLFNTTTDCDTKIMD